MAQGAERSTTSCAVLPREPRVHSATYGSSESDQRAPFVKYRGTSSRSAVVLPVLEYRYSYPFPLLARPSVSRVGELIMGWVVIQARSSGCNSTPLTQWGEGGTHVNQSATER